MAEDKTPEPAEGETEPRPAETGTEAAPKAVPETAAGEPTAMEQALTAAAAAAAAEAEAAEQAAEPAPTGEGEVSEPVVPEPLAALAPVAMEPQIDAQGRAYATGKRKNAVARVWIKPGGGQLTVNGRDGDAYFARPVLRMILNQPLVAVDRLSQYDVWCTVRGGGLSGQAGAVRHGVSKALSLYEPPLRPQLKSGGFLTRDSRVVERKKYGKRKARRSFQFSKR